MNTVSENELMKKKMLEEPIGPLLFKKAAPSTVIQLITIIYNTADTYFVAKISTQASAAVGIVFSLMAIIQAVGFGLGMGASSLISRRLGASREHEANVYGSSALAAGIIAGMCILVFGLLNIQAVLGAIGASASVMPYAVDYGTYILIAAPFMCVAFIFNAILRAEGQAFLGMIGMTTGGVLNMILDPLFIFTLGMGIKGASIATMISQIVGMIIMGRFFITNKSIVRMRLNLVSRHWSTYVEIVRTGFPTICRQGLASLSTSILNVQAAVYGDAAVAAISIANKIYILVRDVVLGIGQGYQPIAGYCYGAGDRKRVKKLFWLSTIVGTAITFVLAVAIFVGRVPIMGWFRDDSAVIAIGSTTLLFCCLAMPVLPYMTYVNQTYQCLGFALGATFLACCRQGIMFVPLAFILPRLFGVAGIESLQMGADMLTFLISIPFQIHFFRRHLASGPAAK